MRKIFILVFFAIPLVVFSQDTIMESRIVIQGFPPEPVLMNSYSNDLALKVDTSLKPIVKIDGTPDPLTKFIQQNITYPQWAVEMGIQWNIYAMFNVETSGEITHIKMLKKGDKVLNDEVMRVLEMIPPYPKESKATSFILQFSFELHNPITHNKRLAKQEEMYGDWRCVKKDRYVVKEYYEPDLSSNHFRLSNDTLWYFEYPNQFYTSYRFNINDSWYTNTNAWFQHDTLVIYNSNYSKGGFHYYLRDTFDQNIIDQLITDTIYLPSLFRKWYVETKRPDDIEYGPPIKIKYPVHVPPVFKFEATNIAGKRMVWLNINGTKRKFRIIESSLQLGYILLESVEWRKESFKVKYFTEKRKYD